MLCKSSASARAENFGSSWIKAARRAHTRTRAQLTHPLVVCALSLTLRCSPTMLLHGAALRHPCDGHSCCYRTAGRKGEVQSAAMRWTCSGTLSASSLHSIARHNTHAHHCHTPSSHSHSHHHTHTLHAECMALPIMCIASRITRAQSLPAHTACTLPYNAIIMPRITSLAAAVESKSP